MTKLNLRCEELGTGPNAPGHDWLEQSTRLEPLTDLVLLYPSYLHSLRIIIILNTHAQLNILSLQFTCLGIRGTFLNTNTLLNMKDHNIPPVDTFVLDVKQRFRGFIPNTNTLFHMKNMKNQHHIEVNSTHTLLI